ncbi:TraR/DksA C4-type zinc finger protein [Gallaecimonas kandeliae]|uniref:TraR/DksA family transcriptional regulator n=1 Tax=Gallaecimonas kandeliae TaxID=3029055 RepID=UPI002647AF8C|nr:TraR/DksA C4-type zinc finger protein [Gallaecimonas kandeliae]WKE64444.1 TraR/DksA C4-type zinc finger protein [Gallaecimonas kandeliae]
MPDFQLALVKEQEQLQQKIKVRLIEMGASRNLLDALDSQGLDGIGASLALLPDRQLYGLCQRLGQVEAALCQLDLGLFGICSDCDGEIEVERLVADPAEQRCSTCSHRQV